LGLKAQLGLLVAPAPLGPQPPTLHLGHWKIGIVYLARAPNPSWAFLGLKSLVSSLLIYEYWSSLVYAAMKALMVIAQDYEQ
jgi:hypothetical protein